MNKKDAPHLIPATRNADGSVRHAPRSKANDEKLRVFREWSKGEASGKGRARSPAQYDAEAKGQKDRKKKTKK